MPTVEECKRVLSNIGFELGVSPKLIATRLLSEEDKDDMLNGLLPVDSLRSGIKAWMKNGMPDYAHGNTEDYRPWRN